jgi:hypothetical protein
MQELGIDVEYELHSMSTLLPRSLFDSRPELFRMDKEGERQQKGNLCIASDEALSIVADKAVEVARILQPTTHRYYFWMDDMEGFYCLCPHCRGISPSDQSLIVMERILSALRSRVDPMAQVAYLAYCETLPTPTRPIPEGIFLEYAPYRRRWDRPLDDASCPENAEHLRVLQDLLTRFDPKTTHILEYWVDCSLFSGYKKPPKAIPFYEDVMAADMALYKSLGTESVTSFAVDVDEEYERLHGLGAMEGYARVMSAF